LFPRNDISLIDIAFAGMHENTKNPTVKYPVLSNI
jgi:hypothetical protein